MISRRGIYFVCGIASVGVAIVGVFLPLIPTTPMLLLAAFCFERSSKRLHRWLVQHPRFGPLISDWNQHGVIRPRVKWLSVIMLWAVMSYPIIFKDNLHLAFKAIMVFTAAAVTAFILTRRSHR